MPPISTFGRLAALAAALALALPAGAGASRAPVETVIQDDALLLHSDEQGVRDAITTIRGLGFDRVRITAGWSVIAPDPESGTRPDFDAADPAAYPQAGWAPLDRAVRLAVEGDLKVVIDIAFWAPRWATAGDDQAGTRQRTNIDPREFALFSAAVARRYSGSWAPPAAGAPEQETTGQSGDKTLLDDLFATGGEEPEPEPGTEATDPAPLPAVDMFTLWNEPNHRGFLLPQWGEEDGRPVPRSADLYRAMVAAAYPAVKAAAPTARVLVGGTAAMGSSTPYRSGVTPLAFLRRLACVDARLRPISTGGCADFAPIPGEGWAHHPYSLRVLPDWKPRDPDKVPVGAIGRLSATLRTLVERGRLAPGLADLYLTEYGYETGPPDPRAPFTPEQQPHLLAWAEAIATADPAVRMWPQFQLVDLPGTSPRPGMREWGDWQSGLYFEDGTPKPAARDYALPVFARCARKSGRTWVELWGRHRRAGGPQAVEVEVRRASDWTAVAASSRPGRGMPAHSSVWSHEGGAVRRWVRFKRGASYRLRWEDGARAVASADAVPFGRGCR